MSSKMSKEIKLIHKFLCNQKDKHDFLVFPGGAGGDYLSGLISTHSSLYVDNITYTEENNKFKTVVPYFYRVMTSINSAKTQDMDDEQFAIRYYYEWLKYRHIPKYKLKKIILEANNWLSEGRRLIRIHPTYFKYFSNNAFAIVPDTLYWKKYCRSMMIIKLLTRPIERKEFFVILASYKESLRHQGINVNPIFNNLEAYIRKENISLLQGHIYILQYLGKLDAFDKTSLEIVRLLHKNFFPGNPFYTLPDNKVGSGVLPINMSDIFSNKKILSSFFSIDNELFEQKVLEWHTANLNLLEQHKVKL